MIAAAYKNNQSIEINKLKHLIFFEQGLIKSFYFSKNLNIGNIHLYSI
jgi:hypothetical protein